MMSIRSVAATLGFVVAATAVPAHAQDRDEPVRYRVALGPQVAPRYPGSDGVTVFPFVDLARAKGDQRFTFEAPDQNFGLSLLTLDRLTIGPVIGFQAKRRSRDVGGVLPEVGFTIELGGFAQYQLADPIRLRAEVRQGIGGHDGLVADLGADYVARQGDDWLFSIGPRVTLASGNYNRTYFGVSSEASARSGLRAYRPDGGLEAVGVTAGYLKQLTPHWGLYGYARYDRLVADPADSPVVARYGSRSQPSAGIAATYTFGR